MAIRVKTEALEVGELTYPNTNGSATQTLSADGAGNIVWADAVVPGISAVQEDPNPVLGGDLNTDGLNIATFTDEENGPFGNIAIGFGQIQFGTYFHGAVPTLGAEWHVDGIRLGTSAAFYAAQLFTSEAKISSFTPDPSIGSISIAASDAGGSVYIYGNETDGVVTLQANLVGIGQTVYPTGNDTAGTVGQVLTVTSVEPTLCYAEWQDLPASLAAVEDDTAPKLGGNLDAAGRVVTIGNYDGTEAGTLEMGYGQISFAGAILTKDFESGSLYATGDLHVGNEFKSWTIRTNSIYNIEGDSNIQIVNNASSGSVALNADWITLTGNTNTLINGVAYPSAAGADGQMLVQTDVSGIKTLTWQDVPEGFSGAYGDLTGAPSLATVATSGAYADLSGKPSLATVATTGAYSDLTGLPNLVTILQTPPAIGGTTPNTGAFTTLTTTDTIAAVGTSSSSYGRYFANLRVPQTQGGQRYLLLAKKGDNLYAIDGTISGRRVRTWSQGINTLTLRIRITQTANPYSRVHYEITGSDQWNASVVELTYAGETWFAFDAVVAGTSGAPMDEALFTGSYQERTNQLLWVIPADVSGVTPIKADSFMNWGDRLRISAAGKVGIGTSAPERSLEIVGEAAGADNVLLQLRNNSTTDNTATVLRFVNSTSSSTISGASEIVSRRTNSPGASDTYLTFRVSTGGAEMLDAMTLHHDGVASIGGSIGAESLRVARNMSNVNRIDLAGASATNSPSVMAEGLDANINLVLSGKGTGTVKLTRPELTSYRVPFSEIGNTTGSLAINCNTSNAFRCILTGNVTAVTITNAVETAITLIVQQDATGGRTITGWPAAVKWPSGTPPTLTVTPNGQDIITLIYNAATGFWFGSYQQGYA